jgi:hypothetical protein
MTKMADQDPVERPASIEAAEARRLVGKALYVDDYIGEISKKELQLLSGPHGPQRKTLRNGRVISIIARCPPSLRKKLDAAIGRDLRSFVQYATAIDVLHDNGFRNESKVYDRRQFTQFLKSIHHQEQEASPRPVGKPPELIESVMRKMTSDILGGRFDESMKGKELADKYGVSRGTAVKARQEVLKKLARK